MSNKTAQRERALTEITAQILTGSDGELDQLLLWKFQNDAAFHAVAVMAAQALVRVAELERDGVSDLTGT